MKEVWRVAESRSCGGHVRVLVRVVAGWWLARVVSCRLVSPRLVRQGMIFFSVWVVVDWCKLGPQQRAPEPSPGTVGH